MAQYDIKYDPARDTMEQFRSIQYALEEYSDKLKRMSKDAQKGLENEASVMANLSAITLERSEDIGRTSASLMIAINAYHDAERLAYERLTLLDTPKISAALLRITPLRLLRIFGIFRMFRMWSNIARFLRPNWGLLPALIPWRSIWLIYPLYIMSSRYALIRALRYRLILSKLLRIIERRRTGTVQGLESGDTTGVVGAVEGAGVTALPEEDFAEAEAAVEAETGTAESAVEMEDPVETVEPEAEEAVEEDYEEYTGSRSSGGSSGGYSGEQADDGYTPLASDVEDSAVDIEFTDSALDDGYAEESVAAAPVIAAPIAEEMPDFSFSEAITGNADEIKAGSGLAAPIIGVAAVSSVAASGIGLGKKLIGSKKTDGQAAQAEAPVVKAKEATGNFSGNLKGEYIVMAAAASILFAGASLKAGIGAGKKEAKPDDRFRIGYGTSAVLSGGAIQERS